MSEPGFWDDQQRAASISAEHTRLSRRLDRYERLRREYDDARELLSMDGEMADEIEESLRPIRDELEVFPAFVVAMVITEDLKDRRPAAAQALAVEFNEQLTTERLGTWNARIAGGSDPTTVHREIAAELLAEPPPGAPPPA